MTIQFKAIEQYVQVVLFVFDNFAKYFFLSFELGTLREVAFTEIDLSPPMDTL